MPRILGRTAVPGENTVGGCCALFFYSAAFISLLLCTGMERFWNAPGVYADLYRFFLDGAVEFRNGSSTGQPLRSLLFGVFFRVFSRICSRSILSGLMVLIFWAWRV